MEATTAATFPAPPPRTSSPPPYSAAGELPSYSPSIGLNERCLASPVEAPRVQLTTAPPVSGPSSEYYEYSTNHMSLNLGRRVNGTSAPSYGKNSVIEGTLTVSSFKHAKKVTVTIWGKATIIVTDRGFPILHDRYRDLYNAGGGAHDPQIMNERRIVLLHTIVIWSSESGEPRPTGPQHYAISFPLPTYSRGRTTPLPPTMSSTLSNVELEVRYSVNIDMIRQGFHRHECTSTVFFYLPRSIPSSLRSLAAAFEEVEAAAAVKGDGQEEGAVEWQMTDANPTSKQPVNGSIVQFGLPLPFSYTAGQAIPFRATIISLAPELSAEVVRGKLKVELVRVALLTIGKQRIRLDRFVGVGDVWKVDTTSDTGMFDVTGSVKAGKLGGEVSWALPNFIEIRYAVKFTLVGTENLPGYKCEHIVQLVTDESQAFEADDEARERPALGLINQGPIRTSFW